MTARMGCVLALLCAVACSDYDPEDEANVLDNQADWQGDGEGKADVVAGTTVRLALEHGAVVGTADRPNLVAYVPAGYDAGHLNVVVFLHGWWNCARNVVGRTSTACTPGRPARQAYNLAGQLEAAGKNAILLVPELAYDLPSGDPGRLAEPDAFASLIEEALARLADHTGGATIGELERVVVASHSGGYRAAASIATRGGLWVDELWLLDSLYGQTAELDAWAQRSGDRVANVYTAGGGTLALSQAMVARAVGWFGRGQVVDDRGRKILTDEDFAHRAVWKRSGLSHDDVPRYYFRRLVETSALADRP